jgi:carotenoid cleavage dioxygenase
MPRTGGNADVKWFDVEPCYIFHTLNAFDEGDTVVLDACRSPEVWRKAGEMGGNAGGLTLHRFRFDMKSGNVKEETLDDRSLEFPRVADGVVGQKNRFGFLLDLGESQEGAPSFAGITKLDFEKGTTQTHDYGAGRNPTEPVFVPAAGSDPNGDDGWVLGYVHNEVDNRTDFVVLDASDLAKPPVATVAMPQRVPYGFHGSWMPDDE